MRYVLRSVQQSYSFFFNVTSCCVSSKAANIEFVVCTSLNFVQSPF